MKAFFQPGITTLLEQHRSWLAGRKIGLVCHPASVDRRGTSSAELLLAAGGTRLVALFGPEHGFFGAATAGEAVRTRRHPCWKIPVYSLYGKHRRPTPAMLKGLDAIVFDLQDLGARPYTYVSSLRYLLEEAARYGTLVVVADRPIPLPRTVDGPMLDPRFESFVAAVPTPVSYGMTPGEAALWIKRTVVPQVDLKVAPMRNYHRDSARAPHWPPWIPPSPGIRSWESAVCYTATVFGEALPALDYGRGTGLPFQLIGAPWMKSLPVCERLSAMHLPGVGFHPHPYLSASEKAGLLNGIRLVVTNPGIFRPILTGISILHVLQTLYGRRRLWRAAGTRPDFFDKLMGTDSVREALIDGEPPHRIEATWHRGLRAFNKARKDVLLYDPN